MSKRTFPTNPDCPLTHKEKKLLTEYLDNLEWEGYLPIKHLARSFTSAIIIEYNEFKILIEMKSGIERENTHTETITIERNNLSTYIK